MGLEKDGNDHLELSCQKLISNTFSQGRKEHPAYNQAKEA
jgi:hypothetical protein